MDNNKIIIILLVIIAILLLAGLIMFGPLGQKDVNLNVITANSLYDGDNFGVSLTRNDGKVISNAKVDVTINDANGGKNSQTITTDEKGEGFLQLNGLTPGKYKVDVSYTGGNGFKSNQTSQEIEIQNPSTTVNSVSSGSSGGQTVSLDLNSFDTYVTKNVGDYEIKAEKWKGGSIGGLGVWVYKNGKLLDKNSYSSRGYICMDGQWKWTEWSHGEVDAMYHKYNVGNDVEIQKVEVSF